jgi:hypothetical protein
MLALLLLYVLKHMREWKMIEQPIDRFGGTRENPAPSSRVTGSFQRSSMGIRGHVIFINSFMQCRVQPACNDVRDILHKLVDFLGRDEKVMA